MIIGSFKTMDAQPNSDWHRRSRSSQKIQMVIVTLVAKNH